MVQTCIYNPYIIIYHQNVNTNTPSTTTTPTATVDDSVSQYKCIQSERKYTYFILSCFIIRRMISTILHQ